MVVEETSCMATKAARRARKAAEAAAATAATAAATTGSAKDQYCSASVASLWPISIVLLYVAFLDLGLVGVCCAMVCNGITDRVGGGSMGFDVGRFVFSLPLVRWDEAIQRGGQLVEIVLNMERFRKPFITSGTICTVTCITCTPALLLVERGRRSTETDYYGIFLIKPYVIVKSTRVQQGVQSARM